MNTHAALEELLETAFSAGSCQMLHNEDASPAGCQLSVERQSVKGRLSGLRQARGRFLTGSVWSGLIEAGMMLK